MVRILNTGAGTMNHVKLRKRRGKSNCTLHQEDEVQVHGKRYGKSKKRQGDIRKHGDVEACSRGATQTIDLSYKNISGKEVANVLKPIFWQQSSRVTSLNLSNNSIDYYGASQIANILKLNKTLNHIDLSYNNLDDKSLKVLIRHTIIELESLKEVNLSWNGITGETSLRDLCEIFEEEDNDSLTILDLSHNLINDPELVTRLLISVISGSVNNIRSLDLIDNPFVLDGEHVGILTRLVMSQEEIICNININVQKQTTCPEVAKTLMNMMESKKPKIRQPILLDVVPEEGKINDELLHLEQ
ncbi:hypothetical protein AKO1_010678 [Acrasis kona]|uniref:Uncharacterized protein n=1 Tax=Acrasis kona TaxID=1008807 RepID=A0AAW2ZHK9_9EUKA